MPQYATKEQLVELAIPANALAGVTDAQKDAALVAASVTIDSYLGTRFDLPLAVYGSDITVATAQIAAWFLISKRGISPGNEAWEALRTNYKDQLSWLKDVSAGRAVPSFPTTKDTGSFDPQDPEFVVAPLPGTTDPAKAFWDRHEDAGCVAGGYAGKPKLRGW